MAETKTLEQVTAASRELVGKVRREQGAIAHRVVGVFRQEIVDYQRLGNLTISDDVLPVAMVTIGDMLDGLLDGNLAGHDGELEKIRRSATRRVHQNVSLPALLQSYRIWGAELWAAMLQAAGDDTRLRLAALGLASDLFDYVNRISVAVAQVYLEEAAGALRGHDVLRTDVLESLLLGRPLSDRARLDIARLNLGNSSRLAVVLVRLADVVPDQLRAESIRAVQACRETIAQTTSALVGVREHDAICVVRISTTSDEHALADAAERLASDNHSWRVCLGRPQEGLEGIPKSFHEAQESAVVASMQEHSTGHPVHFAQVMLDRILVHSEYAEDLLDDTVRPLIAYDRRHGAQMLQTLRAYVTNNFSLAKAANQLLVNPKTVAYRLHRIQQLTGHDPSMSNGMVTLALAVRLLDG